MITLFCVRVSWYVWDATYGRRKENATTTMTLDCRDMCSPQTR